MCSWPTVQPERSMPILGLYTYNFNLIICHNMSSYVMICWCFSTLSLFWVDNGSKNLQKSPYPNQFPWPLIWFANFSSKTISPLFSRSIWSLARHGSAATVFGHGIFCGFATVNPRIYGCHGDLIWNKLEKIWKMLKWNEHSTSLMKK